jgi:hypothetical protein
MSKLKEWWPPIKEFIDVAAYLFVGVIMIVCMFRKEWLEGTFWAVFYCTMKLHDIKETLDERL